MKKRIIAIDVLRGFALLGILLMNIMSFAMPDIAYFNPTAYGGSDPINQLIYAMTHLIADQKFMALFSILFGASVMLITNSATQKGQNPAKVHYVRNLWLLLIGLIHAIFIWSGDVLTVYALSAFALYFFRKLAPKWQFLLGLIIFFTPSLLNIGIQAIVLTLDTTSQEAMAHYWHPLPETIANDLALFRGGYRQQLAHRIGLESQMMPTNDGQDLVDLSLLVDFFSRALGMMLMGMAFFSWGILTAVKSRQFYQRLLIIGFGLGYPLTILGLILTNQTEWQWQYALFLGRIPNNIATPLIASGYIALIMLWSQSTIMVRIRHQLAAVGRMALTNYIAQSIIATSIFYGFGLGLYGSVARWGQLLIILLIWGIQLWLSTWWLAHFRYGPLEWLWRSLTYRQWQPLQKQATVTANR